MMFVTLAPDLSIGLWMSLLVILTTVILCPVLCWILPDRHHQKIKQSYG